MQGPCAGNNAKSKCDEAPPAPQEECDHSFCTMQRRKKNTGCVDLPPKGLPWASGLLRYLPGQRDLYRDLYLKEKEEQDATMQKQNNGPCKKNKQPKSKKGQCEEEKACLCFCAPCNGKGGNGNGMKKRRSQAKRASRSSRSSRATASSRGSKCSDDSEDYESAGGNGQNCCVELEQVFVCDGTRPQPRKGWLVRPCKRPELAEEAMAMAASSQQQSDDITSRATAGPPDPGMICLMIPRSYLQQCRPPQEDICAKYGIKTECVENDTSAAEETTAESKSVLSKQPGETGTEAAQE